MEENDEEVLMDFRDGTDVSANLLMSEKSNEIDAPESLRETTFQQEENKKKQSNASSMDFVIDDESDENDEHLDKVNPLAKSVRSTFFDEHLDDRDDAAENGRADEVNAGGLLIKEERKT